ncbi:hypothetical protein PHIN109289_18415 [Phaeobacter inhibens]
MTFHRLLLLQFLAERFQRAGHFADFATGLRIGNIGMGFALRHGSHPRLQPIDRPRHTAQQDGRGDHQQNKTHAKSNHRFDPHLGEVRLDVGDIRAGADDPAPGFKRLHIADFLFRRGLPRFLEPIADRSGAVACGDLAQFLKNLHALHIFETGPICADPIGHHRMRPHNHILIEGKEISGRLEADFFNHFTPLGARLIGGKVTRLHLSLKISKQADGRVDDVV